MIKYGPLTTFKCLLGLIFLSILPLYVSSQELVPLKINIFSSNNGKGLEASRNILKSALQELGHEVISKELNEEKNNGDPKTDINIYCERINIDWLDHTARNWFIPNPECYEQGLEVLKEIDLVLCRTHEVERIFQELGNRTYFMGFTSQNCKIVGDEKDYYTYFHLGGGSPLKGTQAIIEAWSKDIAMPNLLLVVHNVLDQHLPPTIQHVSERLILDELRTAQNSCGVHLCPSETEGFGHYLMEAMSTGAVVVTTDAPPMNEFIRDKECLVPYFHSTPCQLGIRYFVDPEQLKNVVKGLMSMPEEKLRQIGINNRRMYLQRTLDFKNNLERLMREEVY